ncbi:alpha/beta hydrolase [Deinococcus rubellus]|uniref:alpha/beta hydrolase family protein n=1 Tax=Deinococcus rubellus TaxID=1889240 RepID=UPI0031EC0E6B
MGCAPTLTQASSPAQTAPARQALTIDFGDVQTKAELTVPRSSAALLPTVILIPGSGPEDMDATISSSDGLGKPVKLSSIFKTISDFAASSGFAVLRYNKHYVTGPGQFDAQKYYTKLDLKQMLADAENVLEAAKANPRVDAKHIYLYGWSEGSTVAAALVARHPEIAGLIVQGPVALSWRETFLFQIREAGMPYLRSLAADGKVTDATLMNVQAGSDGLVAKGILNYIGDPSAYQTGKIAINPLLDTNNNGALDLATELTPKILEGVVDTGFASFFGIYASGRALPTLLEAAPKLKLPVLILQGQFDSNVPEQGAQALEAALKAAGNTDATLKVYPGLGHSLGSSSSLIDDNFRPIAAAPLTDLVSWLRAHVRN